MKFKLFAVLICIMSLLIPTAAFAGGHNTVKHNHWSYTYLRKHPCGGGEYLHNHTGIQMWAVNPNQFSYNVDALICSAAPNSTIDIKTWFLRDDGMYADVFYRDLALVHKFRHVRINVMVSDVRPGDKKDTYGPAQPDIHLYNCHHACRSVGLDHGNAHAKWITVSKTIFGGPALVETSANFTNYELHGETNSGIYFYNDLPMYNAFINRWNSYVACADGNCAADTLSPVVLVNHIYYDAPGTPVWQGQQDNASVYFSPQQHNPLIPILKAVNCVGGSIFISNPIVTDPTVIKELTKLKDAGCTITMDLGEHPGNADVLDEFNPVCIAAVHDKVILIQSNGVNEVLAGSVDLQPGAVYRLDNQTINIFNSTIYNQYMKYFVHRFRNATSDNCLVQTVEN